MYTSFTISSFASLEMPSGALLGSAVCPKDIQKHSIHSRATLLFLMTKSCTSHCSLVKVEIAICEILLSEKITTFVFLEVWKIGMWLEQIHVIVFSCKCFTGLTMRWSVGGQLVLVSQLLCPVQWQCQQLTPHRGGTFGDAPWLCACTGSTNAANPFPARHFLTYG